MLTQLLSIGIIVLLGVMSPGPDFACVVKNTVLYSRRAGLLTSLGIAIASLIHIFYCSLGLAIVISKSVFIFNTIKYIGGSYLIYLGMVSFFSKPDKNLLHTDDKIKRDISDSKFFREGFLCNLLNPKATLFFLALFTMVIHPNTPRFEMFVYMTEMFFIIMSWFFTLSIILSHPSVSRVLETSEKYISKLLGIFLMLFGFLLFVKQS